MEMEREIEILKAGMGTVMAEIVAVVEIKVFQYSYSNKLIDNFVIKIEGFEMTRLR